MELPSKIIEQIAFITRSRTEEHILIVMDKSTHEKHLSQPLQTIINQLKIAVTFLTFRNGIFTVTSKNNEFFFLLSITDEDGYIQVTIPPSAYKNESLIKEIQRRISDEKHYTEANYPFTIKPNFSTLGGIVEIPIQGPIITFVPDDSIRDLLGFNKTTIC